MLGVLLCISGWMMAQSVVKTSQGARLETPEGLSRGEVIFYSPSIVRVVKYPVAQQTMPERESLSVILEPQKVKFSCKEQGDEVVLRTAKVLCRWAWNAALLCAAVPVFCAAGFFLICAGTLTVLLVQGYPVVGLLLGSVGLVLCGGGVLVFALTLIWRKPANGNKEVPDHA